MTACIKTGAPWNVIQAWQKFTQSHDCGPTKADGKWGPMTREAVGKFQKKYGIPTERDKDHNYIVGPKTYAKAEKLGFTAPNVIVPPGNINVMIDISHHQAQVDMAQVKQGGKIAVIHKCTQGTNPKYVDDRYTERQQAAKKAGLLWGAYHFGEKGDGRAQADYFLKHAHLDKHTICVLDWEAYKPKDSPNLTMNAIEARDFIAEIYRQTGKYPGLYGNQEIKKFMGTHPDPIFQKCWLWLANYTKTISEIPAPWKAYTFWQYTSAVHVPGVEGCCDNNFYAGDEASLRKFWTEHSVSMEGK
jgi:lysozyme